MLRHPLRFHRDHRFAMARASDYLDGDLDEAGRSRIEEHARLCPKCYELLTSLRRTILALSRLHDAPDAGDQRIASSVIARLRDER